MLANRTHIVVSSLALALLTGCLGKLPQAPVEEQPPPTQGAPNPATGLTATPGNATVTLTWTPSSNASTYNVKRATTPGGPYTQIANTASPTYIDTNVTNGVTYYYVVTVVGAHGESHNSNEASATPDATMPPDPPGSPPPPPPPPPHGDGGACSLTLASSPAVFCETFDAPAGIGNRSGDLDGNVWGVSHGGSMNFGQGQVNEWNKTTIEACDGAKTVTPPHDIIVCDGQLREASNDNNTGAFEAGGVTALTIYPKQPFDFAGRTGTVAFDISNDSAGTHSAWPEFWMTNLPVPAPFNHFDSWQANPQHGFAVRFAATAPVGQWGLCPNGNNLDHLRWTVDSVAVFRNYVLDDTNGYGPGQVKLTQKDCVIASSGVGGDMNHVELRIATDSIEVWATDAGVAPTASSLRLIAELTNTGLTFTRGLIWLEDVHYNADKGPMDRPSQREHTFAWDNVAFDGPFTYRDFSYDALDNTGAGPNGAVELGKAADANQTTSWSVLNMPANRQASAVRVLFNYYGYEPPSVINVNVNGHAYTSPNPYPNDQAFTWRTHAVTINLSDLVTGTNTVLLGTDKVQAFGNVNIVLVDVPNGVPVLPGSDNSYPN